MKGVNLRHEPKRPTKQWGVWIEVIIGGKELRGRRGFNTEADAQIGYVAACQEIAAMRAEADENDRRVKALAIPDLPPAPKGASLFETVAERWLAEHVKPMREAATYRGYRGVLDRYLLPIMRTWPVTDDVMSPQRLKDVLKRQLHEQGLSLQSRRACQRCLSAALGWAVAELPAGQLTRNPIFKQALYIRQETEKTVKLKQPANPMTADQAEAFLSWIFEQRRELWEFFLWLVDAGSRVGEASAVRFSKIDLEHGRAHVVSAFSSSQRWLERQQGDERGLGEKGTKTHREDQYIDLSDRLTDALRALKVANLENWLAYGRRGTQPDHVFLTRRLTPRRPDGMVYEAFRSACDELKLAGQTGTPFTIHNLRDTFATLAILGGRPIGWVSMMLGHADEQTTRSYYYKWIRTVEDNPLSRKMGK